LFFPELSIPSTASAFSPKLPLPLFAMRSLRTTSLICLAFFVDGCSYCFRHWHLCRERFFSLSRSPDCKSKRVLIQPRPDFSILPCMPYRRPILYIPFFGRSDLAQEFSGITCHTRPFPLFLFLLYMAVAANVQPASDPPPPAVPSFSPSFLRAKPSGLALPP